MKKVILGILVLSAGFLQVSDRSQAQDMVYNPFDSHHWDQPLIFKPASASESAVFVVNDHGKMIMEIRFDGRVVFGTGVSPDKATLRFVEELEKLTKARFAACETKGK